MKKQAWTVLDYHKMNLTIKIYLSEALINKRGSSVPKKMTKKTLKLHNPPPLSLLNNQNYSKKNLKI